MLPRTNIWFLVFMTALCHTGFCQYSNDSSTGNGISGDMYTLYMDSIAGASQLYNGSAYLSRYSGVLGSPFFETKTFVNGSVCYNGVRYTNVALKYDLVTDELIIRGFQNHEVSLTREKIDSFSVMNHLFVKAANIGPDVNAPTQRFYDVVYDGKVKFLVTRSKVVKPALHAEDPSSFIAYNTYYVVRDDEFYGVPNKKTLIRVLGGRSDAMKVFWKNNTGNFKRDAESLIRKAVEYHDQIKRDHE